jgi:hypothetical protein
MSRLKSEVGLQAERERSIRRAERALRRAERDAKRQARLERQAEQARAAAIPVPRIKPEASRFGLQEALSFSGLMDCDRCHRITREQDLISGVCELCRYADPEDQAPDLPAGGPGPTVQLGLFEEGQE